MSPRHLSILAASLILLGGTVAIANPASLFGRQRPPVNPLLAQIDPDADREGWLGNLNLTPEQMQKVRSIRNQHKDTLAQQRKQVGQAQRQLREMMTNEASVEQIRQQYAQVKTLREQLADTQFNSLLETREVLTLEQRRRFGEQMQQRRGRKSRGAGEQGGAGGRPTLNDGVQQSRGLQHHELIQPGALFYE